MDIQFDLSASNEYARSLLTLHRSAFPSAVRATLTEGAKITKTKTLDRQAKTTFERRDNNFFKANSKFIPATGWNVNTMKSTVGMFENKLENKPTNWAVKNMEQQEKGGSIKKRAFIPMKQARTGGKRKTKIKYLSNDIKGIKKTSVNESDGRTMKQQFVRASIYSVMKQDGLVLGHKNSKGNRVLFKIDFIRSSINGRKFQMKYTKLYNYKKNRKVDVNSTSFMEKSAVRASRVMPDKFRREAERQFLRHLNR